MRRLPIYFVIQVSGAMRGEPISAMYHGLNTMVSALRDDPYALETVWFSVISYSNYAKQIVPLTELTMVDIPELPQAAGGCHLGEALQFLCNSIDVEVVPSTYERKGDWKPWVFIMTDGRVNDIAAFNQIVPVLKQKHFGSIVVCLVGNNHKTEYVKQLTTNIVSSMENVDWHFDFWASVDEPVKTDSLDYCSFGT